MKFNWIPEVQLFGGRKSQSYSCDNLLLHGEDGDEDDAVEDEGEDGDGGEHQDLGQLQWLLVRPTLVAHIHVQTGIQLLAYVWHTHVLVLYWEIAPDHEDLSLLP